jgi:hypothetical protein
MVDEKGFEGSPLSILCFILYARGVNSSSTNSSRHYLVTSNCGNKKKSFRLGALPSFPPIFMHDLFCAIGDGWV